MLQYVRVKSSKLKGARNEPISRAVLYTKEGYTTHNTHPRDSAFFLLKDPDRCRTTRSTAGRDRTRTFRDLPLYLRRGVGNSACKCVHVWERPRRERLTARSAASAKGLSCSVHKRLMSVCLSASPFRLSSPPSRSHRISALRRVALLHFAILAARLAERKAITPAASPSSSPLLFGDAKVYFEAACNVRPLFAPSVFGSGDI